MNRINHGAAAGTVVDHVVERIVADINDGRLVAGQRLVEADVTQMLDVSRSTLREALSRLAEMGFVRNEPHRGAVVRTLTKADLAALYEIREVLEGLAARRTAQRIGERDVAARIVAVRDLGRTAFRKNDLGAYIEANGRFHNALIDLAQNPELLRLAGQLHVRAATIQLRRFMAGHAERAESHRQHEAVIAKLLAGDARGAESAMRAHLRSAGRRVLSLDDRHFDPR